MGSERARNRVSRILWESAGRSSTAGSSERRPSGPCSAKAAARRAWDETFAHRSMDGFGAFILGRNMFGPVRGEWLDDSWNGWWGDNPPYHAPTFVLTHHAREPIVMEGGTTFHFVTDGIHTALERARDAAGAGDVKIGGGVSTVRQYLQAC